MMAIYLSFDINYPKYTISVLLFIQHFVVDLKDDQPMPPPIVKLVSNQEKINLYYAIISVFIMYYGMQFYVLWYL